MSQITTREKILGSLNTEELEVFKNLWLRGQAKLEDKSLIKRLTNLGAIQKDGDIFRRTNAISHDDIWQIEETLNKRREMQVNAKLKEERLGKQAEFNCTHCDFSTDTRIAFISHQRVHE